AKAQQVAGLIGQADGAAASKNWDAAVTLYDEALKLDPQNQHALDAKKKAAKADVTGFDSSDVSVQKAPDFLGRIEFAMTPASIKPGESYSLKIYLVN